jgi:hypothetical protein
MQNEIIIYQSEILLSHIEVRVEDETVWSNRIQIANLFVRDVKNTGENFFMHLKKSLKEFKLSQNLRQLQEMAKHIS